MEPMRLAKKQNSAGNPKLNRTQYETERYWLQAGLCELQKWVKIKGWRLIVVFEGHDAAGKGGSIKAITERVSPRGFRVVALPAPSDREKSQMDVQRYMQHVPAAGELVIFDRSWYNRAAVEYVMGFCPKEQHCRFLEVCPGVEKFVTDGGIHVIKDWLEVGNDEQKRRFEAHSSDPLGQWQLSPVDLPSRSRWYDDSHARDMMLEATDTKFASGYILRSDDKKRARLNGISQFLRLIAYKKRRREQVQRPMPSKKDADDNQATLEGRNVVTEKS